MHIGQLRRLLKRSTDMVARAFERNETAAWQKSGSRSRSRRSGRLPWIIFGRWTRLTPPIGPIMRGPFREGSALPTRMGMIPDPSSGVIPELEELVRLIGSRDVLKLTGLSGDQLREWTVRRGLIHPDVPASRQGQQAQFGWQTVLVLRLAVVMRSRFHVELQVHRDLLARARGLLSGRSFPSLWGHRLAIFGLDRCALLGAGDSLPADEDVILLALNVHLEALSQGFGVAEPIAQLPLFPAVGLRRSEVPAGAEGRAVLRAADGDAA